MEIASYTIQLTRQIPSAQIYSGSPEAGPNIVLFTGGSGSRELSRELPQFTYNSTHIIGTHDDGKSSGALREAFEEFPAFGDLRSRLADLADPTLPEFKGTTAILKHRLPKDASPTELEKELASIVDGSHSLFRKIPDVNKRVDIAIMRRLIEHFNEYRLKSGKEFDLAGGSIGNFFLAGSFLFLHGSLENALNHYKRLASVRGNVIPATLENVYLGVHLTNGETLWGQRYISHQPHAPVDRLFYFDRRKNVVEPELNSTAADALRNAELIVYSIGSFYTSLLSSLHLKGVAEAIRKSQAPKVFIANPTEEHETVGLSFGSMAAEIIKVLRENDSLPGLDTDYLQFVIGNNHSGTPSFRRGFRYISGDTSALYGRGIEVLKFPLVSDNQTGKYDPEYLTRILLSFVK